MMLHLLCHMLLLVFLSSTAVVLVKASDNTIRCGYDVNCQAIVKLMADVDKISSKLDQPALRPDANNETLEKLAKNVNDIHGKQLKDLEELKVNMNKSLASTAAISTQLAKHSADLSTHDERFKANDVSQSNLYRLVQSVNEKLDKLSANVLDIQGKQAKDVELLGKQAKVLEDLKEKLDRSPASTAAALSTQFERISKDLLSHDERLKAHDVSQTNLYQLVQSIHDARLRPRDCSDIREKGSSVSGVYRVYPVDVNRAMDVYCDFKTVGQSWLVFQRRKDGSVNFDRTWNDYANGFGDLNGEFWLGNEKMSLLTMNKRYKLRIEMEDFLGGKRWAEYATFSVKPSTDKYRLSLGAYSGNAGDSFVYHNNMKFSTKDADNDPYSGHCAQMFPGGWWYNQCHHSNLNGQYLRGSHTQVNKGVYWYHWKGYNYSLKTTEMKITAV